MTLEIVQRLGLDNPALCIRDYLTSSYGLNEETANIDDTLVTTAANVCDQTNTLASTKDILAMARL